MKRSEDTILAPHRYNIAIIPEHSMQNYNMSASYIACPNTTTRHGGLHCTQLDQYGSSYLLLGSLLSADRQGVVKFIPTGELSLIYSLREKGPYSKIAHHCLKGVLSIWTIQFFTNVLVLTSSLLLALYTTSSIRVLRVTPGHRRQSRRVERIIARTRHGKLTFWSPWVVAMIKSKGTVLLVSSSCSYNMDTFVSNLHSSVMHKTASLFDSTHTHAQMQWVKYLSVGRCSPQLKLSLLSKWGFLPARGPSLMPTISRYTWTAGK